MSTTLRYLHHPASQPCRAAHQFMLENDIPFELELVDITTDINERPEFRDKYNPTGQVPILVDGDFVIWESAAIAFYLNEKFNCPDHWFGREHPAKRAYSAVSAMVRLHAPPRRRRVPLDDLRPNDLRL